MFRGKIANKQLENGVLYQAFKLKKTDTVICSRYINVHAKFICCKNKNARMYNTIHACTYYLKSNCKAIIYTFYPIKISINVLFAANMQFDIYYRLVYDIFWLIQ